MKKIFVLLLIILVIGCKPAKERMMNPEDKDDCLSLSSISREICIMKLADKQNDAEVCKLMKLEDDAEECIIEVAKKGNYILCEGLRNYEKCYSVVYRELDPSVEADCDKVRGFDEQIDCKIDSFKKNHKILRCDYAQSESARDGCLKSLADETGDLKYCKLLSDSIDPNDQIDTVMHRKMECYFKLHDAKGKPCGDLYSEAISQCKYPHSQGLINECNMLIIHTMNCMIDAKEKVVNKCEYIEGLNDWTVGKLDC